VVARTSTHGLTYTAEYTAWAHMLGRCYRPTDEHYDRYGGRGISVCQRWHRFENFYADMKPKGIIYLTPAQKYETIRASKRVARATNSDNPKPQPD